MVNGKLKMVNGKCLITKEQALKRFRDLKNVRYEVKICLGLTGYCGIVKVGFDQVDGLTETCIEFDGEKVHWVLVGGNEGEWRVDQGKIWVGGLAGGENEVEVGFENFYSRDGHGLNFFCDPDDGRYYVYSHLEPFLANRFLYEKIN